MKMTKPSVEGFGFIQMRENQSSLLQAAIRIGAAFMVANICILRGLLTTSRISPYCSHPPCRFRSTPSNGVGGIRTPVQMGSLQRSTISFLSVLFGCSILYKCATDDIHATKGSSTDYQILAVLGITFLPFDQSKDHWRKSNPKFSGFCSWFLIH